MAKLPLTTSGTRQKTEELYALDQRDLDEQARRIKAEFGLWMDDNFILNQVQRDYISQMEEDFLDELSTEISESVRTRFPIVVIIPEYPPVDTGTKRIVIEKDGATMVITVTYDN